MGNQIHVYEAVKKMEELSERGIPFSFAFYKYNREQKNGGDLARISRAQLRKKTPDSKIAHSSYKLFFIDLDSGKSLNCWQPLIVEFNGTKCILT